MGTDTVGSIESSLKIKTNMIVFSDYLFSYPDYLVTPSLAIDKMSHK